MNHDAYTNAHVSLSTEQTLRKHREDSGFEHMDDAALLAAVRAEEERRRTRIGLIMGFAFGPFLEAARRWALSADTSPPHNPH